MSNYKGFLLKFGNTVMPNEYFSEYSSTPNQRTESDANRDQFGDLHRTTLPHVKTSISFSTHILYLDEKIKFQSIINNAITNFLQRRIPVTYWNDETNSYCTGIFYMPDLEFQIIDADSKTVKYNPITVELIEY